MSEMKVWTEKDIENGDIKEGTVGTACGIFSERYSLRSISVPKSVKYITESLVTGLGQNLNIDYIEFYNDAIPDRCLATNGIKSIFIYDPN